MAIHSSTIAWKIPWTEEPGRLHSPWGRKESDTTERLHFTSLHGVGRKPAFSKRSLSTFISFLGSTDKAVRPINGRSFLKVTQPVKGRARLERRAPDSQAGALQSPVLFASHSQTKDF